MTEQEAFEAWYGGELGFTERKAEREFAKNPDGSYYWDDYTPPWEVWKEAAAEFSGIAQSEVAGDAHERYDWDARLRAAAIRHRATPAPAQPQPSPGAEGDVPTRKPWAMLTAPEKAAALIEELERTAERITRYSSNPLDGLLHAAANVLRELTDGAAAPVEGAAQSWISVKDQLPEAWIEVLVHPRPTDACCEGHVDRAGLWQYTQHDSWGSNPRACVVTHWLPIPAAPKEKP